MWRSTLEIGAARHSFAPLQKSRRNHHSYEWTQAPYGFRAGAKLSDIAWAHGLGQFTVRRRTKRQNNILCSLQNRRYLGRFGGFRGKAREPKQTVLFLFLLFSHVSCFTLAPSDLWANYNKCFYRESFFKKVLIKHTFDVEQRVYLKYFWFTYI